MYSMKTITVLLNIPFWGGSVARVLSCFIVGFLLVINNEKQGSVTIVEMSLDILRVLNHSASRIPRMTRKQGQMTGDEKVGNPNLLDNKIYHTDPNEQTINRVKCPGRHHRGVSRTLSFRRSSSKVPIPPVVTLAVPRSVLEQTPALNMIGELERLQLCLCLSTRSSTDEKQLKFAIVKRGPVSTDHLLAEDAFEWSHGRF